MNWKPQKWIAATLTLFIYPLGLVYAGAPRLATLLFLSTLSMAVCDICGYLAHWKFLAIQISLLIGGIVVAYRLAKYAPVREIRFWYTRWYGLLGICAFFILLIFCMRLFFYESFVLPSSSMLPTAAVGTKLIVQKWGYGHYSAYGVVIANRPMSAELKRGDIIAFDFPPKPSISYMKRIVGLPGDDVEYRNDRLSINGKEVLVNQLEDYVFGDTLQKLAHFTEKIGDIQYEILIDKSRSSYLNPDDFEFKSECLFEPDRIRCKVPPERYFVLGDNRSNSLDSRQWGFVRQNQIIGKVVKIFQ